MIKKNNNNYHLIKIDNITKEVEYFDFETMNFSKEPSKAYPLSSIDSLTTMFESGQELDDYLNKNSHFDREYSCSFEIIYKGRKTGEIRSFQPVWNDSNLNSISKVCDGKVDFTNERNYDLLFTIIEMSSRPETGLALRIAKAKGEATRLSDQNKSLITAIASANKPLFRGEIQTVFSNYKEFRALYLNYKEHNPKDVHLKDYIKKLNIVLDNK